MTNTSYDPLFDAAGQKYNLNPTLLKTVFQLESGGNPNTPDSNQGAVGGMQILPSTAASLGVDPTKMPEAIDGAARYLKQGVDATGTAEGALAYYHGGPNRAEWGPKTAAYVAKGQGLFPKMASAPAPTQPQAQSGEDIFRALTGAQPSAPTASTSTPMNGEDIFKALTASVAAPSAPTPAPVDPIRPGVFDEFGAPPPLTPEQQAAPAVAPTPYDPNGPVDSADHPSPNRPQAAPEVQPSFLDHVGGAIGSAFQGPLGPSDADMGALVNGPSPTMNLVNRLVVGGGGKILDALGRPITAAARGLGALASEGVQALGSSSGMANRLERDISQAPSALAGMVSGSGVPGVPEPAVASPYANIANKLQGAIENDVQGPGRGKFILDKLTTAINNADPAAPASAAPEAAEAGGFGPQSLGAAATPSELSNTSNADMKAGRATAERSRLIEAQPPGPDFNEYVPGVQPTEAHMVQNARTSRNEKLLESQMPDGFKQLAAANNDARTSYFQNMEGTPTLVQRAIEDRSAQAEKDLTAAFQNTTSADAQPVLDQAAEILASPDGVRPPVQKAVASITNALTDSDGNIVTDPQMLYGVRKHIDDMLSPEAAKDNPLATRVTAQLLALKSTLDNSIEAAAPGFRQYLDNFAEASKPIDEMQVLQKYAQPGKIYDSQSRMTYSGVQRMMKDLVAARGKRGIDPAQSVSDDTMNNLFSLRDDLRRVASADDLARAKGSDTANNLADLAKKSVTLGAHGVANFIAPGVGSIGLNALTGKLKERSLRKEVGNALNPNVNRLRGNVSNLPEPINRQP